MEPLLPIFVMLLSASQAAGVDTLAAGDLLRTNQTLISISNTFALGFFDAGNFTHMRLYLAVWYNSIPGRTVVWVANRAAPLTDLAGGVTLTPAGDLAVLNTSAIIWSTSTAGVGRNTTAVLEETGNLVLRSSDGTILWQSFDYPTDTYLPGMKLRLNLISRVATGLVSWAGADDPSPGEYYVGLDPAWPAQFIMLRQSTRRWRSTMWSDNLFSEAMSLNGVRAYTMYFTVVTMADEMSLTIAVSDNTLSWRFQLNTSGVMEQKSWLPESGQWDLAWNRPRIPCHLYSHCGANGVCNRNRSPECQCLPGHDPKMTVEWSNYNWSAGCERRGGLSCDLDDEFLRFSGPIKLPDLPTSMDGLSVEECEDWCLKNCSCRAYSYANVSFGPSPRCLSWTGDLMDLEEHYASGQDLFIRLSRTELNRFSGNSKRWKKLVAILVPTTFVAVVIIIAPLLCLVWRRSTRQGRKMKKIGMDKSLVSDDFPLFDFGTIKAATNNFSAINKLGQGGFGPVYKGKLPKGEEIAVKRLSQSSGQGYQEFKNEVELIAKLQHKNLVKLLGWCIHKKEKLIIYEFLPNKSLDKFLFEPSLQSQLNWRKRFHITKEIAQGLLYLHRHSLLKIIHRDLKTSNILLDGDMNPKISDFGLAKIVRRNNSQKNTSKVVGTYGYIAPEYALNGLFSEKSDVFSFGVILLELISGKRNTGSNQFKHSLNLLGHAWVLWKEDKSLELMDPSISESCVTLEVARCIHIALLCVQEDADDRPDMSSVILMLNSTENASDLPCPKEPAFSVGKGPPSPQSSSNSFMYFSIINTTTPFETGDSLSRLSTSLS